MSIDVAVSAEGVRLPLPRATVQAAVTSVLRRQRERNALVSITFVDRTEIARLNRRHLRHAGPTDVITFSFARISHADPLIGDVYISPDVARENAAARGIGIREELLRLVIHGALHLCGFDHPEGVERESSAMWREQERAVRSLLPSPRPRSSPRRKPGPK